jgi:hypothetical protein
MKEQEQPEGDKPDSGVGKKMPRKPPRDKRRNRAPKEPKKRPNRADFLALCPVLEPPQPI